MYQIQKPALTGGFFVVLLPDENRFHLSASKNVLDSFLMRGRAPLMMRQSFASKTQGVAS
jgi:hypothetical protein